MNRVNQDNFGDFDRQINYQCLKKFDDYEADFAVSDEEDHQIMPKAVESKAHAIIEKDNELNQSPLNKKQIGNLNNNLIPRGVNYPTNDRIDRQSR